ncbi:hypothetical protein [Parafrigoribacterium soli]|uniref:hypothetical protein n=1 Tax=Parafrigoribacterium soli TaxID=3144663 RepID=UPI00387E7CE6
MIWSTVSVGLAWVLFDGAVFAAAVRVATGGFDAAVPAVFAAVDPAATVFLVAVFAAVDFRAAVAGFRAAVAGFCAFTVAGVGLSAADAAGGLRAVVRFFAAGFGAADGVLATALAPASAADTAVLEVPVSASEVSATDLPASAEPGSRSSVSGSTP